MSLFLAVERFCSRRESSATVKTMLLLLLLTHSVLTAEQGPPPDTSTPLYPRHTKACLSRSSPVQFDM